ncbi:MAG TPA: hypothetical protein VLL54_02910 [Pyrinomonadaceae bacterium]|nr:hypothetical protein [Pyrinomonadaceae bacterium]
MNHRISTGRLSVLFLILSLVVLCAPVSQAKTLADEPMGLLTVTGMVKVNGQPAATGDIVASGSGVETAAHSSAVVSLGKLGRVEALPETKMMLRYTTSGISVVIEAGSVRVQTGEGVSATITRKA